MQQVKFNKQMQQQYRYYKWHMDNAPMQSIFDAYKNPSCYKVRAYNQCIGLANELNGFNFTILGHNCQTFSVGFECYKNNKLHFVWITACNTRICCVE